MHNHKSGAMKRLAAMFLIVFMLTSMIGECGSVMAFAEEASAVLEQPMEPKPTSEPEPEPEPEPDEESEPTPTQETETTVEPTVEPTATTDSSAEEEVTDVQADELCAIEAAVMQDGFAYVRTSASEVQLYRDSALKEAQLIGTIVNAKAILCATAYVPREGKPAAVLVSFAAEGERIRGYVSERDLKADVLTLAEVEDRIRSEQLTVDVWLDGGHAHPLPETDYVLFNEEETDVETEHSSEVLYNATISLVEDESIRLRKTAEQDADVNGRAMNGSVVAVTEEDGEWCWVMTEEGTQGYVRAKYLTKLDKEETAENNANEVWTLTDGKSGVCVTLSTEALPEGVLKENVVLRVRALSSAEEEALRDSLGDAAQNAEMVAFDISLMDTATGEEFQPECGVRVSMPIPEDYSGDVSVYHMEDEGATLMQAKDEDGACLFSTEGFSPFVMLLDANDDTVTVTVSIEMVGTDEDVQIIKNYAKSLINIGYEVYRNGSYLGSGLDKDLNTSNNFKTSWELPKYDSSGNEYVYTVKRWRPATISSPFHANEGKPEDLPGENNVFTDTWTVDIEPKTVTATIKWSDLSNRFEKRPTLEELGDVILSYGDEDDTRIATVTENEDGTFTATWENVPMSYNGKLVSSYDITEPGLPPVYKASKSGSNASYTLTNQLQYKSFTAYVSPNTILYDYIFTRAGFTMPASLTATLCVNGVPLQVDGEEMTHVFYPSSSGSWALITTHLPQWQSMMRATPLMR